MGDTLLVQNLRNESEEQKFLFLNKHFLKVEYGCCRNSHSSKVNEVSRESVFLSPVPT